MQSIYSKSFTDFIENQVVPGNAKKPVEVNSMLDAVGFFVHVTRSALKAFARHKFAKFDALVGDTACQIRALKIAELAKLYLHSPEFQDQVKNTMDRFERYQNELSQIQSISSNQFFKEFKSVGATFSKLCEKYKIDLSFSDDLKFIVESYILQVAKGETEDPEAFYSNKEAVHLQNFEKRCEKYQHKTLAKNALKKIVEAVQRDLSHASIQYLLHKLEGWPDTPEKYELIGKIKQYSVEDDAKRLCSPCYYNMQAVFREIVSQDLPFYVHVCRWTKDGEYIDSVKFLYKASSDGTHFERAEEACDDSAPVVFLHGVSIDNDNAHTTREEFAEKFSSHGITDILDANWAQHRQFPRKKNETLSLPDDERRDRYLKIANEWGCSFENKSLFLAVHMYCDTYKNARDKDKHL